MKRLLPIALLLFVSANLLAQRLGPAHFSGQWNSSGSPFIHAGYHARYYPVGLFDPFYNDYLQSTGYPAASQPPVILLQAPPSAPPPEPASAPSQPLMIELQGDRYVQISGNESSGSEIIDQFPRSAEPHSEIAAHPTSSALLIFRDGRRQEVTSYTITNGVLYAASDYATTGAWTQKIDLRDLNVPETIAQNNSRNVRFQLPTSPNEVTVGP